MFKSSALYKAIIVSLYILLLCLVFLSRPTWFNYDSDFLTATNGILITLISIISVAILNSAFRVVSFSSIKFDKKFATFVLYATFLIAVPEEILFRGFMQNFFQAKIGITSISIFLSSLIYGLAHLLNGAKGIGIRQLNWKLAIITFLVGIPLGMLYEATGSLLFPTIWHALLLILFGRAR